MDGSRSIPVKRSSLGFLLFSAFFIVVAALIIFVPLSSDDSDAGEIFYVDGYQYETLSTGSDQVKVSALDKKMSDVIIYPYVVYDAKGYTVKEIADFGFANMTELKTVEIKEGVEVINSYAFYQCTTLNAVTLPTSLTKILAFSFCNCESLESIWIRLNVSMIDTQVFFGCTKLKSISVDVQNEHYMSSEYILYNKDKTRLLQYPTGRTNDTYNMPNTVESVDEYSMYCAKFKNVILSNLLVSINKSALEGSSIVSLTITQNVASIGERALSNCSNLKSISVSRDNNHYVSLNGVLFTSSQSDLIAYPSGMDSETYYVPSDVKNIREYAFLNNAYLKEVYLDIGITTIGRYAFSGCSNLERVNLSETIANVAEYAYSECTSLRSIQLSKLMTTIDVGLFKGCTSIEVFYIPTNITVLKDDAFAGCTGMTSLYIPSSIVQVNSAFPDYKFYDRNQITVIGGLEIVGHTYIGTPQKMCQQIGTYSAVYYDENGGSIMIDDQMVKHNQTYTFPEYRGVREGYRFMGWIYNLELYAPGATMVTPTANANMTAEWEKIVEEDTSKKITLEITLAIIITVAGIAAAIAVGLYFFKFSKKKQILKDDDDALWK